MASTPFTDASHALATRPGPALPEPPPARRPHLAEFRRPDGGLVRLFPSETARGAFYQTTARGCTCPEYQRQWHQDVLWRCTHMRRAFPIYCWCCGEAQVPIEDRVCEDCAAELAREGVESER